VHRAVERKEAGEPVEPLPLPELARLMAIYDPEPVVTIRADDMHAVAGYTPFEGITVKGRVRTVLSRGQVIVHDGSLFGELGRGRFLRGEPFEPIPVRKWG